MFKKTHNGMEEKYAKVVSEKVMLVGAAKRQKLMTSELKAALIDSNT